MLKIFYIKKNENEKRHKLEVNFNDDKKNVFMFERLIYPRMSYFVSSAV